MLSVRFVSPMIRALFCGTALTVTMPAVRAQQAPLGTPQAVVPASGWRTVPSCNCPTPQYATPAPSTTPPTTTPTIPQPDPTTPPSVNVADAGAGARGGEETGLSAPNMYGDAFGGAATRSILSLITPSEFNGHASAMFPQLQLGSNNTLIGPSSGPVTLQIGSLPPFSLLTGSAMSAMFIPPTTNIQPSSQLLVANSLTQVLGPQVLQPLLQHTLPSGSTALPITFTPNGATVSPDPNNLMNSGPFTTNYSFLVNSLISTPLVVTIPSPSAGGVVGRTKISDDNSPLPRDRVIFNYDYFDNAQLTSTGVNVHRFSPGFEKTFFDQMASIEVRVSRSPRRSAMTSPATVSTTAATSSWATSMSPSSVCSTRVIQ